MTIPPTVSPADDPTSPSAAPDWATTQDEITCPLCGYNLRGLIEPRCPECGYTFQWPQLLNAKYQSHPYLFEHHPARKVWSFWKTTVGGLRPRRFWTSLTPVMPSFPGRLLAYWLVATAVGIVLELLASFQEALATCLEPASATWRFTPPGGTGWTLDTVVRLWMMRTMIAVLALAALQMLWPWLTFATLQIFQISMRRAGVRNIHVLRCVLYSADAVLWFGILALLGAGSLVAVQLSSGGTSPLVLPSLLLAPVLLWLLMIYRLYVAYKKYLHFDQPLATMVATQIIVWLGAFTAFMTSAVHWRW